MFGFIGVDIWSVMNHSSKYLHAKLLVAECVEDMSEPNSIYLIADLHSPEQ